jgi:hypothetical protein
MKEDGRIDPVKSPMDAPYEPPRVEQVLDAADLMREVHYAGSPGSPTPG